MTMMVAVARNVCVAEGACDREPVFAPQVEVP